MHATAAQVHECHERVSVMEAECPASDGPDLSVEPLGSGVRESRADVFDDTVQMPLDRVGDSSEVAQAGRPRLRVLRRTLIQVVRRTLFQGDRAAAIAVATVSYVAA